jgi:hypothetical protein
MDDLITIKVKDEERKLTKSFPYPPFPFQMSHDDAHLKELVNECLEEFKGDAKEIQIRTILNW